MNKKERKVAVKSLMATLGCTHERACHLIRGTETSKASEKVGGSGNLACVLPKVVGFGYRN
jgi:hypothetical protein